MKKTILIITILFSIVASAYAEDTEDTAEAEPSQKYTSIDDFSLEDRTDLRAPLQNLFKSTAWETFLQEFEIKMKMDTCGSGAYLRWGFKAHMIEPIGYMETTKKPLNFPFADIDLGGNILKSCSSRASSLEESTRDECFNQHFIYAPILGMIFKKKLEFLCLHQGTIALPILSEFNPAHLVDIYAYKMIPHMIAMVSPQAIISSVLNCAATTAESAIRGYSTGAVGTNPVSTSEGEEDLTQTFDEDEWAAGYVGEDLKETNYTSTNTLKEKGLNAIGFIRNTMFYNVGCIGFAPVGGYVRGQDPGADNVLLGYGTMAQLHGFGALSTIALLQKQTEFGMEVSATYNQTMGDTMCQPKNFAMPIETQYAFQRAYPTVAGTKETGESPISTTTMANKPGSKDSFVNVFWQRRDYLAFAYTCPSGDMSGE